jgi:hypothetical protein
MMIFNLNFQTGQISSRALSRLVHTILAASSAVLTGLALPILRKRDAQCVDDRSDGVVILNLA